MADDPMNELKKRADDLVARLYVINAEKDVDKQIAMINELARDAAQFEEMGKRYVAQEQKRLGRGYVQVVLTPEQQLRILNKTGIKMDLLVIEDQVGAINSTMPTNPPEMIEKMALDEAMRRKHAAEADVLIRREAERTIAALEEQHHPEIDAQLAKVKADPNFLGGVLNKKATP